MTPFPYLLFIFAFTTAGKSALEEINTAIALNAAKDNPVLLKILQTVDTATNNERLFDVTLNLLKSLCVCMRETLRAKQMENFQLSREMISLQTEDEAKESNRKVLDIYQNIYNKTCFDLREELAMKVNKSRNLTPEEEKDFTEHSNCGKKAIDENTEDYERLTSQLTQVDENKSNVMKILHTTFVTTRNYHKFYMRKFNLFKNSQKSMLNSVKHSIIVILTFYPHQNTTYVSDNFTEVNIAELNITMYSQSPIDIDVIDTRYGHKENTEDGDFIPKPATDCSLKSIYSFLLQSEQVNKTKVFKILRKKGTIKVYIDIPTQINHIDYSKVCCSNETEIPLCKIDFSRERFDSHEITTYLPKFKKRKKLHRDYKDTISKIKNLVKLYDRKLNWNKSNQLKLKTDKNNIKSKFNNIMTGVEKNLQAGEKDNGDNVILRKDIYFKLPFRSKLNDLYPVTESVTLNKYFKEQYITEKYISLNTKSSNESEMNTVLQKTNDVETKNLLRPTLYDDQNRFVSEVSQVTNITKIINLTKPTASTETPVKTITFVGTGLEENTDTNATYGEDNKSSIFQSYQMLQNSTMHDHVTTVYDFYITGKTYPILKNNEFKTETKIQPIQNTTTENLATKTFGYKTADDFTERFSDDENINNNTVDYSDSTKIFKMTGNYSKHKGHNRSRVEPSVKTKDSDQISNTINVTRNIKLIYNTVIKNFDVTNTVTAVQNTNNENYEITSEIPNGKEIDTRNKNLQNLLIPTDKYFNMHPKNQITDQFDVAGMNKILARNHTKNSNYLKVKGAINFTTDYWNTPTLSNLSDMKAVTTSFKTFDSYFTKENLITSLVHHYDNNDLQSLVSSDQRISQLIKPKGTMQNKNNLQVTKDQPFRNSTKSEIPFLIIDNDIEEKSSSIRTDEIIIKNNSEMTERYNLFDSFKTMQKIITNTNNQSESSFPQTTEAVINFQLLQPELENTTVKNHKEVDTWNETDILSKSTKKSIVNHIKARNSSKNTMDTENTYFNETYVTKSVSDKTETVQEINNALTMTKIFNTTIRYYGKGNTFESFLQSNRNSNDNAFNFEDTRADSIKIFQFETQGDKYAVDHKLRDSGEVASKSTSKGPKLIGTNYENLSNEVGKNLKLTVGLLKNESKSLKINGTLKKVPAKLVKSQNIYITDILKTTDRYVILNLDKEISRINNSSGSSARNELVTTVSRKAKKKSNVIEKLSTYFPYTEESLKMMRPLAAIKHTNLINMVKKNTQKDELIKLTKVLDTSNNIIHGITWSETLNFPKDDINDKIEFDKEKDFESEEKHNSYDAPIPKVQVIDNGNTPGSVIPYLETNKTANSLKVSVFENNTKSPRVENKTNISKGNIKVTKKPYSDHKYYLKNVDATIANLVKESSHLKTEEIYTSSFSKTSKSKEVSDNRENFDKTETKSYKTRHTLQETKEKSSHNLSKSTTSYGIEKTNQLFILPTTTEISYTDKKVLGDLTAPTAQFKFTDSNTPYIEPFAIMGEFKSSKEFSDDSGDAEHKIKEDHSKALRTTVLPNKGRLLLPQVLTVVNNSLIHIPITELSAKKLPELVNNGSSIVLRQQVKSDILPKTAKLNDATKRSTKIAATNNTGNIQREFDISVTDIEQNSSKANKSRITRSPRAMKNTIGIYNQISSFSTTVPFSDNLIINFSTTALQNDSNSTNFHQSPELSKNFEFTLERTKLQSSTTVDPSLSNSQTEVIMTPRTEKYHDISENDQKITTYIISPNAIQDTDTKKSIAELQQTDFKALNTTSDERDDVKNIYNIVKAAVLTNQTFIDKSYNFNPKLTKNKGMSEINYVKTDKNIKSEYNEIRYTVASRLTTNSPQILTYDGDNTLFETPHDVKVKEKKVGNDLQLAKNIYYPEIKSTITDKYVGVSLEPRFTESIEKQLIQSLQMLNISDSQNNSKTPSFERVNNRIDSEAPSSLEDINNDIKKILNFLNESSHTDQQSPSTTHNKLTSDPQARFINNLTITQQLPVSVIDFTKNIPGITKISDNQEENKNNTLIFSKENTLNINIRNLLTTELINDLDTTPDITDKLPKNSIQSTKDETQRDVLQKIAIPKFYKFEYLTQPITPNSSVGLVSSTNEGHNYRIIFPENKDYNIEQDFTKAKTSSFGDYWKATTPNYIKREHTKEISSDHEVSFEFIKQNIPVTDGIISRLERTEKNNKSVTKPQVTLNPQLKKFEPVELFKPTEYSRNKDITQLTEPSKDFAYFYSIDSLGSSKGKNRGSEHDSIIVNITNITSTKYIGKAHDVASITVLPYKTENISESQNINTILRNNRLSDIKDPKFETAKENVHVNKNLTSDIAKLDEYEHKDSFDSMTDFDNYETLETMNSTPFQDNLTTQFNILHKILNTKVYNFTSDKTAFLTPTGNTILFQLSDFPKSTKNDSEFTSNILKPSPILNRQYNGDKTNKLGFTKMSPSSITYFTQIQNTNATTSFDLATEIYESFRIEKQKVNNEVRASANATFDNVAENEKQPLNDLLTTNLYKAKMTNEFEAMEKVKNINIDKDTFKNIFEVTKEPGIYVTQASENIKADLATLTISPLSVQVIEFSNFTINKLDEAPIISNISKTSNAPKQFIIKPNLGVTDLSLNTTKSVTKARNVNKTASIDLVSLKNYSVGIKEENSSINNNVTSSHVTDYSAKDKTYNFSSRELLNTDKNKTFALENLLSAKIFRNMDTNSNIVDNKDEITKDTKSHASVTSDGLRIRQNASSENETDLETLSRKPNYFEVPATEENFEGNDMIYDLEKSSFILNQQQADILHDIAMIKTFSNSGEFHTETHHKNSTPSRDRAERMYETIKITKDITATHNILNPNYVTVGYLTDIKNAERPDELNALKSIELLDDINIKSGIFKNYLDITEAPRFEATLTGKDLRIKYHNLLEKESEFTSNKSHFFTQATESTTNVKSKHSTNVNLFNNGKTSHFSSPQYAGDTHSLKENNLHSPEYQNLRQTTIKSTLKDQDAFIIDKFKTTTKSSIFSNDLQLTEAPSFTTTLTGGDLTIHYQNLLEKETVLATPHEKHFIETTDNSTYIEYRHGENVTISNDVKTSHFPSPQYTGVSHNFKVNDLDSSEYKYGKQNKIESTLRDQDASITKELKNDIKYAIYNNDLVITEAPSYDSILIGEDLKINHKSFSQKETEVPTPNESHFFIQTTESSTLAENKYGNRVTISNNENPLHYSRALDGAFSHNLKVAKLYYEKTELEYENVTQNTIKATLKDKDAFVTDQLKKTTETAVFNKIGAINYVTVGNLSENEVRKHISEFEPINVRNNSDTQLDIINVPLLVTKKSNFDKTQTEAIVKNLRSEPNKTLNYFTENTTAKKNSKVIKSKNILDSYYDLKTRFKEETFNSTNSVKLNSFEDDQKNFIVLYNLTKTQKSNKTLRTDKKSQFNDKFIDFEKNIEINKMATSHNEIVNDMAKKKIHKGSLNQLAATSLIEKETHKDLESAVVSKIVGDQPKITDNFFRTTANGSFEKIYAVSLLTNLSTEAYNSFVLVTESTRQSPTYLENTTFTEIPFNFLNEKTVSLKENEHVKGIFNTANTSSFLNSNYRDKVSYTVTESLIDSLIRHDLSTDAIVPLNTKYMVKKENTGTPDTGTSKKTLINNLAENVIHNILSNVLHVTELDKSKTMKKPDPVKIYDSFDTRSDITDQQITVTVKPSLYEIQGADIPFESYNLFQYPRELTMSKKFVTMGDNRNDLETKITEQLYNSQGNLNVSKGSLENISGFLNQTFNYSDVTEYNNNAHETNLKSSNARNTHLYDTFRNTKNVTKTLTLVEETNIGPKVEHTELTARPLLNETETVEFLSVTEQNKTEIPAVLITNALTLSKDDIMKNFNSFHELSTANYYNRSQRQNIQTTYDVGTLVDNTVRKDSFESITNKFAIIETATDSYHFLNDLTFFDTKNFSNVTDERPANKIQTGLDVQFTIIGDKTYDDIDKMHTPVLPLEENLLENETIMIKDTFPFITRLSMSKKTEIPVKSSTKTEQQNIATTSDYNVHAVKNVASSEFNETLNIILATRANKPPKITEPFNIWLNLKPSNSIETNRTGSDHPHYLEDSHAEKIEDVAFYNAASDNLLLINESTTSMEKKPTVDGLKKKEQYEMKNIAHKHVIATTENVMSEANITTIFGNKRIIKLLNKIRSSFNEEFKYANELRRNAENNYFSGTTPLSKTELYLTDSKLYHETDPINVFEVTKITQPTVLEHYPVTKTDLIDPLQSKTAHIISSTRHNEIKSEENNISSNTIINTTERITKYLKSITDIDSDKNAIDTKLTNFQDYTYPISSTMYNIADKFDEKNESTRPLMPITKYMPNINDHLIFDQTRPANCNYKDTKTSISYISTTHTLNPVRNKSISQTPSHSQEKNISFIDLDTPQKKNVANTSKNSVNLRELTRETQSQNLENKKEFVTEVESDSIKLAPYTTQNYFLLDKVFTEHYAKVKTLPENDEDYSIASTSAVPSVKEDLTLVKGTEGSENEIKLTTFTDSNNYLSTLSMGTVNIITKRNTQPNSVSELTLPLGENSAVDRAAMLFNVPPLAFHVTDLKLELVPTYNKNKPQIVPKLHGKFNLSINMESQHVTNSMSHNNTLDVLNKAFADELHPTKSVINSTHGSHFDKPDSEMKKYIENARVKITNHYLANSVKPKKEFLNNNISNVSEPKIVKYFTAKNDKSQNINVERTDKFNEFTAPIDLDQYTTTDIKQQENKSLLLQSSTNLNTHLNIMSSLHNQNLVTDFYTFKSNLNEANILDDIYTLNNTTQRDTMNQVELNYNGTYTGNMEIYNVSKTFKYDKINNVYLSKSTETPLKLEIKETELMKNLTQVSQSRKYGDESMNFWPKSNASVTKILENKLMDINTSDSSEMINSNTIVAKNESNLNKNYKHAALNIFYNENESISSVINGNELNKNFFSIKSKNLQILDTMTTTEMGSLSESATSNKNKTSLIKAYNKTYEPNLDLIEKSSMDPTANTSLISKPKWDISSVMDSNKLNNTLVPIISKPLHGDSIMAITENRDLLEAKTLNQNVGLIKLEYKKTNDLNPADIKKGSTKTSINISQLSELKSDVTKAIDGNKLNSKLVPKNLKPLHDVSTMAITEKENVLRSTTLTQDNFLFVYEYNKTNVQNHADITKSSTMATANTPELLEFKPDTITPILLNIVLIVDKINKQKKNSKYKNSKSQPNKTANFAEDISIGKEHTLKTQDGKLKSEFEKSSTSLSKSKNFPYIRNKFDTFMLTELSSKQNIDPGVTNQNANMLTSVDFNVVLTTASHDDRKKDKNKRLTESRKHQNSKTKLKPIDVKKESNIENKNTITVKTENNLDPKVKYGTLSLNQQVHITPKSLLRTTRQIKYNTYRPLKEEELDPSEFHKIISSFPKYDVKKVKTKNPQQVKNYHDTPYGNRRKYYTKQDLHNKSSIFDPLDKKNIYPIKKMISNPRKIIKRLKLANKRNDIVTMKTEDFFSRRLGVTRKDKLGEILKLYPKPVLKLQLVTTKPKSVILRPKFSSLNTFTKKPAIKKPVILQSMDIDYYRSLAQSQLRRSGSIRNTVINKVPGNLEVPPRIGFGDPVIESPYYIPTIMKPKFLRDRVADIRSYIYNTENEKKPNYRRHFLNNPGDGEYGDDSFVQYSRGNSHDEEDINTPVHRITRPKKTIFFLSPTIPYNRYF